MKTILVITLITLNGLQPSETYEVRKDLGTQERCEKKKAEIEKFYRRAQKARTGYKEVKVSCMSITQTKGI